MPQTKQKYDLVAIGDTTIDTFIRLHDASVHCDLNHKNCQLCLSFADKIPYETLDVVAAVGNSSNLAVGASRLGLKVSLLSAVGSDYFGQQILGVYRREKVSKEFVRVNHDVITNNHFVLNFKAERTILIKHNYYKYFEPTKIGAPEWIYFSSMAENTLPFHRKLAAHLRRNPQIKMGFNPGTFQLKLGAAKLKKIYRHTHVLFVNREEAARILRVNLSTSSRSNIKKLFKGLHKLGPKIVAITDGPDGAYASDGANQYFMPKYPDPKPPFERTGCGDAFSTGFMAALVNGLLVTEALRWGPVNSMSVVQYTGAQLGLLTKKELLQYLSKAAKHYKPKRI